MGCASHVFNVSNSLFAFSISRCPIYLCFPTIEGKQHFQSLGGQFILCGSTSRIWHALEVKNTFDVLKMVACRVPRQRLACNITAFWRQAHCHFHLARLIRATLFRAIVYQQTLDLDLLRTLLEIYFNNLLKRGIIPIPTTGSDTDTLSAGKRETKSQTVATPATAQRNELTVMERGCPNRRACWNRMEHLVE